MRSRPGLWCFVIVLGVGPVSLLGCSGDATQEDPPAHQLPQVQGDWAFHDVNVIPMTEPVVLEGYTVVVEQGRIKSIDESDRVEIAGETVIIDGSGRYVMPGLVDMHVHHYDVDQRFLLVAHGITTIRNMGGFPEIFELKQQYASGELLGPELHSVGPVFESDPPYYSSTILVETAAEAEAAVLQQLQDGWEIIKVYSSVKLEPFDAILDTATAHGVPVVGHVPERVGIEHAVRAGQHTNEHLMEYDVFTSNPFEIDLTVEHDMFNCPTLVAWDRVSRMDELHETGIEGMEYVNPERFEWWATWSSSPRPMAEYYEFTRKLVDAGGKILMGTDAYVPYVIAGFSAHDEMQFLADAGLGNYDVLRAATYYPAESLRTLERAGTVEVGKDADLLLLENNPLEDIAATRTRAGVMLKGVWYEQAELNDMLEALREKYAAAGGDSGP